MIKEAIFSDYEISEAFNKFFANLYPHVKIIDDENFETATKYQIENSILIVLNKISLV